MSKEIINNPETNPGTTQASGRSEGAKFGDDPIGRLRLLLRKMDPFLDGHGRACCRIPGKSQGGRMSWPLDSEPVLSLVAYRYSTDYTRNRLPTRGELIQAITLIRGELWDQFPGDVRSDPITNATIRFIKWAVSTRGDFLGSASDALALLKEIERNESGLLGHGESLPANADQLGILLGRLALVLRESGIAVTRPRRTDTKRLWAWERLTPTDDTPDTPDSSQNKESGKVNLLPENDFGEDDAEDNCRLMTIYSEGSSHETNTA